VGDPALELAVTVVAAARLMNSAKMAVAVAQVSCIFDSNCRNSKLMELSRALAAASYIESIAVPPLSLLSFDGSFGL
jgi:hypothetical protein